MFKRLLLVVITLCCLASIPGVGIPEELRLPPGKTSFAPEVLAKLGAQFPEKPSLPADLAALTASYPGFCLGAGGASGPEGLPDHEESAKDPLR